MSNVEDTLARIYTINFSKAWLTPKHKRTDRVINMIKEFAIKHMKSSQIKIDQELNRYIWEKGKTNPPRKVRVRIVKDDDEQVIVSLYEDIMLDIEPRDKSKDENEEQPNKSEQSKSDSTEATTTPNSKLNDTDVGVSKT
ncbi:50S ribosomal protein L31e [Candidatus Nitrosocosmicus hydrocola]|uniref:50S ribosomal protein L31e n=1 Tax=Candidatus Nitrosocosmicus hydrocola TaxID=1826872 RepID=UPI0011E5B04C|nr:50S ribosomal protein L31e [Candidatus Nitrosocosmicus hydrocola]